MTDSRLRTPRRLVALALLAACMAACGGERSTPTSALAAVRAAMDAGDGTRLLALHDADTRAFRLQRMRTIRARLQQGEPIEAVLGHDRLSADEFLDGSLEEATARDIAARSMLVDVWDGLRDAEVIEEEIEAPAGRARRARLRLRRSDGTETDLYFLEEPEGWTIDQFRKFQVLKRSR